MSRCSTIWTVSSSLLLLVAVPVRAQDERGDQACVTSEVDRPEAWPPETEAYWRARHPVFVYQSVLPLESQADWEGSIAFIARLLREDGSLFWSDASSASLYERMLAEVDGFAARVSDALEEGTADGYLGDTLAARFRVMQNNMTGVISMLDGALTLPEYDADVLPLYRSLCYTAHNVRRFHERITEGGRIQLEHELRERVDRWETFNDKGLTPLPWELVANELVGWFGSRAPLEPPNVQLILLRPSVAAEVDTSLEDRTNTAVVEALGFVTYINNRSWYLGGSFIWTSPTGGSTGYGALVHVAPWIKGGPVWRDADGDGSRDLRWILSVDALDLFQGAPKSLLEAAFKATGGRAGS